MNVDEEFQNRFLVIASGDTPLLQASEADTRRRSCPLGNRPGSASSIVSTKILDREEECKGRPDLEFKNTGPCKILVQSKYFLRVFTGHKVSVPRGLC